MLIQQPFFHKKRHWSFVRHIGRRKVEVGLFVVLQVFKATKQTWSSVVAVVSAKLHFPALPACCGSLS
jgi:cell division protein FtsB